jgi:hypothetical protein
MSIDRLSVMTAFTREAERIAGNLSRGLNLAYENIKSEPMCVGDLRQLDHIQSALEKMMLGLKEQLEARTDLHPVKSWVEKTEQFGESSVVFVVQCATRVKQPALVEA